MNNVPTAYSYRVISAVVVCALTTAGICQAETAASGPKHVEGIWKAAVPPRPMNGEFESFDPMGIAAGARIKADCSLNWVNPDDGRLYCFSSGTSLVFFLEGPQANIERAKTAWRKMPVSPK